MEPFNFDNSYHRLSAVFYADVQPTRPLKPELVLFNSSLAKEIELDCNSLSPAEIARILSGEVIPKGAEPLAMAYAGHQFGHFTMLGDGRAILLGEHLQKNGKRTDIQLKGSGRTPFSRGGDGSATLKAMLREYLMSECMHALGVPTSRSLAVVKTGVPVTREIVHEGAVLTRIMDSHLRFGTFEFARNYLDIDHQSELLNYTLQRHFPEVGHLENRALELLRKVSEKQLELVLQWMRIGFIHGVMNTDNMHIGGQTFDYGPCAFMNAYHPKTVFSSIDKNGRYAYGNQAEIALWNLSVFAGTLLPQIDQNQEQAVDLARAVLNDFSRNYQKRWQLLLCQKIGFDTAHTQAKVLVERLLDWMRTNKADFTNTFLFLTDEVDASHLPIDDEFKHWFLDWKKELLTQKLWQDALQDMQRLNPHAIPRNHLVEAALDSAVQQKNFHKFDELIQVVSLRNHTNLSQYQGFPIYHDAEYQTFCGT